MGSEPIPTSCDRPTTDLFGPVVDRGTVLAVWAHPDDESFCGAGLMLAAAAAGHRVVNVTATLGELGTDDPGRWPPERLGRHRRAELERALGHLGGADLELLGLRDGTCAAVDGRLGARRVAMAIERHRPGLILTFGPDGVTGHPDHRAVCRWTGMAAATIDLAIPVFGAVTAQAWPADLIDPLHDVGAFFPGHPDGRLEPDDLALRLDGEVLDRKLLALGAHASQIGPLRDRLGPDDHRRLFAHEAYRPLNQAARRLLRPLHREVTVAGRPVRAA